jgi:TonB-linked SusC/RagA family outer membrane protein
MKRSLLLTLLACFCLAAHAQTDVRSRGSGGNESNPGQAQPGGTKKISGKLLDTKGEPVVGATVSVVEKATGKVVSGTYTDVEGNFTVSATPNAGQVVRFSYVDKATKEFSVDENNGNVNLTLEDSETQLEEVVVVGYGTQLKRELTGSIGKLDGAQISNLISPSFDQQLAGRLSGVQVSVPNGLLGQAPRIRVRGVNSISGSSYPLVVVDGVPLAAALGNQSTVVTNNPLGDINPSDIESYEVLKDGAATAIYGSRAAAGVILITTKSGSKNRVKVDFSMQFGTSEVVRRLPVLGASDFQTIKNEMYNNQRINAGLAPRLPNDPALTVPFVTPTGAAITYPETDWQSLIFRRGLQQSYNLNLSGGNEKTSFFLSVGYQKLDGPIVANSQDRSTIRFRIDHKVADWLSVGSNIGFTYTNNSGLNVGANALGGNVVNALTQLPNVPVFLPDGSYNITLGNQIGQGFNNLAQTTNNYNLQVVFDRNINQVKNYTILSSSYGEIDFGKIAKPLSFLNGLKFRSQFGTQIFLNDDFQFLDPRHGDGFGLQGSAYRAFAPNTTWNWINTLSYDRLIAQKHRVAVVTGLEYQQSEYIFYSANARALSDPFFSNLVTGTFTTPVVGGSRAFNGFESFFARANYSFAGKYLFSGSIRRDGTSSLPAANRFGWFPGASIGYVVSQEQFFKDIAFLSFVDELKIRASYGIVGNVNIGLFPFVGVFGPAQYASQNGASLSQVGNTDLRWETAQKSDIGFELVMFKNRVNIEFDYYRTENSGLVLAAPTPVSFGVPGNAINQNIGRMRNEGIELHIVTVNIDKGGFRWTTDFNFTTLRNTVLSLPNGNDVAANTFNVTREGQSIASLIGYQYAGVNPANGNPMYQRGDGAIIQANLLPSGGIPGVGAPLGIGIGTYYLFDPSAPFTYGAAVPALQPNTDRFVIGPTIPTWFGGITNTFTYKGFDLEVFIRYQGGHYLFNQTRQNLFQQVFVNNTTEILGRWTTPGQITDVPRLLAPQTDLINLNNNVTTRFAERADFLRVQNITLGYTIPKKITDVLKLRSVRAYLQVQNAFVVTRYRGFDPEVETNVQVNNTTGIDQNANPQQRIYLFGLNIGF